MFSKFQVQRPFGVELQLNSVQTVTMEDVCASTNDSSPAVNDAVMERYMQYDMGI
jgi:hypothetical protein